MAAEWKLNTLVNCYKGKGNSFEIGNYRELKLTDQILEIAERIIQKLVTKQVDIDKMQFRFIPECRTTNAIFILKQLQEKYVAIRSSAWGCFMMGFQETMCRRVVG